MTKKGLLIQNISASHKRDSSESTRTQPLGVAWGVQPSRHLCLSRSEIQPSWKRIAKPGLTCIPEGSPRIRRRIGSLTRKMDFPDKRIAIILACRQNRLLGFIWTVPGSSDRDWESAKPWESSQELVQQSGSRRKGGPVSAVALLPKGISESLTRPSCRGFGQGKAEVDHLVDFRCLFTTVLPKISRGLFGNHHDDRYAMWG